MSSLIQKNIDQIIRTKTTLTGTERFPGRDASGDFKITLSNFVTAISDFLIGQRVGTIIQTMEDITISASDPYFNLANKTQTLSTANYPDYVPYLRALQAKTKFLSTYETTCTVTAGSTTLTLAASKTWTKGQEIFFANQFRVIISGSGTSYTIDEPATATAGTPLWSISRDSTLSNFPITHYSVSSNVVSLYMNNGSTTRQPENYLMLAALAEDYHLDKEYRTITLPNSIGTGAYTVAAGDYTILSVTPANIGTSSAVITFTGSASDIIATALTDKVVNFHPRRISGSTTTARHYQLTDMALMNDGLYNVAGLRGRDRVRGHWHGDGTVPLANIGTVSGGSQMRSVDSVPWSYKGTVSTADKTSYSTDGTNGTPRTGPNTRPRFGAYNIYEYVGTYVAS